jgi:hypothetical protein
MKKLMYTLIDIQSFLYFGIWIGLTITGVVYVGQHPQEASNYHPFGHPSRAIVVLCFMLIIAGGAFNLVWITKRFAQWRLNKRLL